MGSRFRAEIAGMPGLERLPSLPGLRLPSPLEALSGALLQGADIWLKRDDLIHPELSGNKWRKLQGYLRPVLENKARGMTSGLASAGGPHSQHLLAVAWAGHALGLPTWAFVRGVHRQENALLARCRALGMELAFVEIGAFRRTFQASGFQPELPAGWAYIPMGGAGPEALPGIAAFWQEVRDQQNKNQNVPDFDAVAVSAGTGTFAAGLLRATAGTGIRVWVFPAFRPGEALRNDILSLAGVSETEVQRLSIHYRAEQGRFGQIPKAVADFVDDFQAQHGIVLEPIYEAKMLYGLTRLLESRVGLPRVKVLAVLAGAAIDSEKR